MKKDNPFSKYVGTPTQTAHIKTLDYTITYRKLTMAEDDAFNLRLIEGSTQENPHMNMEAASDIKYEKLAVMLIDPKVTVKELKEMDSDAGEAMVEILKIIEPKSDKVVDDEGNSES